MEVLETKPCYRTGEIARAVGCGAATVRRYLPRPSDGSYLVLSAKDAQALLTRLLRKGARKQGRRIWRGLKVSAPT